MKHPSEFVFLLLVVMLGAWLRIDHLMAIDWVIDADEAIVGLMGQHVAKGSDWPVFYYGQHYMGSLEALLVGALFWVGGVSSVTLKLVPLIFSIALIPLIYLLGARLAGTWSARLAALYIALPPSSLVVWSSKARGGFIETLFLGALALLLIAIWGDSRRSRQGLLVGAGLTLGVGWWVNNQIVFFLLPILLWVVWATVDRARRERRRALASISNNTATLIGAFFIGGAPFWWYNLNHDFVSFKMFSAADSSGLWEQFGGVFKVALPILFGALGFWETPPLFEGAATVALSLYGIVLIVVCVSRARHFGDLLIFKCDLKHPVELVVGIFFCTILVFALSSFGYLVQAPRYLLPAYVPLALMVGYAAVALSRRAPIFGGAVFVLIMALNLGSNFPHGKPVVPGEPFVAFGERVSTDNSELIRWLEQNKIGWIRTNYWIGYRIAFETEERVRFRVFQAPHQERIQRYIADSAGLNVLEMPLVVVPAQAELVRGGLSALQASFKEIHLSGYDVFFDIQLPKTAPQHILPKLSASCGQSSLSAAIDGDIATRWGSGMPQAPGMEFVMELPEGAIFSDLEIDLGSFGSDAPRKLQIVGVTKAGEEVELLSPLQYLGVRYIFDQASLWRVQFKPGLYTKLVLRQLGEDPVFDWSIAEIRLFGPGEQ